MYLSGGGGGRGGVEARGGGGGRTREKLNIGFLLSIAFPCGNETKRDVAVGIWGFSLLSVLADTKRVVIKKKRFRQKKNVSFFKRFVFFLFVLFFRFKRFD